MINNRNYSTVTPRLQRLRRVNLVRQTRLSPTLLNNFGNGLTGTIGFTINMNRNISPPLIPNFNFGGTLKHTRVGTTHRLAGRRGVSPLCRLTLRKENVSRLKRGYNKTRINRRSWAHPRDRRPHLQSLIPKRVIPLMATGNHRRRHVTDLANI